MTDTQLLEHFTKIAEFMSLCYASDVEVVVHDVKKLPNSVISIYNSHVSGRGVGSAMTDKGLGFLRNKDFKTRDYVLNFKGMTDKGSAVRSSAFFIRNGKNEVVGMLCVNVDISKHAHMIQIMESFVNLSAGEESAASHEKDDQASQQGLICDTVAEYCAKSGRDLATFTTQDKMEVVSQLLQMGIFERKRGVSDTANHLKLSEPTVYRYVKRLKKR